MTTRPGLLALLKTINPLNAHLVTTISSILLGQILTLCVTIIHDKSEEAKYGKSQPRTFRHVKEEHKNDKSFRHLTAFAA